MIILYLSHFLSLSLSIYIYIYIYIYDKLRLHMLESLHIKTKKNSLWK